MIHYETMATRPPSMAFVTWHLPKMFNNRPRTSSSFFPKSHQHSHQLQRCKSSYNNNSGWFKAKATEDDVGKARVEFLSKTENSALRGEINKRVDHLMKDQEKLLEIRRAKLGELLAGEEEDLQEEALICRRHRQDAKLKEMERRKDDLARMQEEEEKRIVEEKRIQQSMAGCPELRPHLFRKNLLDSKEAQLQQMKENRERRRNAKELGAMWDDIVTRDVGEKLICDRNDAVENQRKQQRQKEDLDVQIREKELLRIDAQRSRLENQLEMDKFDSALRQKEAQRAKEEMKKKGRYIGELTQQIRAREKSLAVSVEDKRKEDEEFARAGKLAHEEEVTREKETAVAGKKEALQYVRSLTELSKQREEEERRLGELLEAHGEEIARKELEGARKIREARTKLHENVLEGRRVQIEHQKQMALERTKQKQAESELMRLAGEAHRRQEEEEEARRRAAAARQYRCDLRKQIEHNNLLREEERQKALRRLEAERREEEKLRKLARDLIAEKRVQTTGHPFRKVLAPEDDRYPNINPIF